MSTEPSPVPGPTADQIRAALAQFLPERTPETRSITMGAGSDDVESGRRYLSRAVEGGWAVPSWPHEHGGRGASKAEAALIARVQSGFAVPDLYPFIVGLRLVGPTLFVHGDEDQQRRWLRPAASGAEIWCQLFSEPEAGSDLANVATRAVRDGDEWVLDGQKVWTSRGAYADWGICLARTDPEVPKHNGLTMFAVRMSAPGVTVRPLVQMNGDAHFSETFLDSVRLPDTDRVGDVGAGWKVALTVLSFERSGADRAAPPARSRSRIPRWLSDLAARGALGDPVVVQRAMQLYSHEQVTRFTSQRASAAARAGRTPGPEGSGQKLRGAMAAKMRASLLLESEGATGMLTTAQAAVDFVTSPSMSIRGGTDEIQRNIVSERVLGLPGEPRADRDVPWSRSRRGLT